jgi:hypothetical protein
MDNQNKQVNRDIRFSATSVAIILILFGITLILISIIIGHHFWKEFLKELGIVLFSVSVVSLIYELWIAEKHFKKFHSELKKQIEMGETNAAICQRLGILQIFPTRDLYEAKYPLRDITSALAKGQIMRTVGRSLFLIMNKPSALKQAVEKGAIVEFCCFDPTIDSSEIIKVSGLELTDIHSALSAFQKEFLNWLESKKPEGEIEIRFHKVHLLDSFFQFILNNKNVAAWDLSFGRDISDKRVFLLDGEYSFYKDLFERYNRVWDQSQVVFHYVNQQIITNNLKRY